MSTSLDPCPWCPDSKPTASVHLAGCRDEPYVVIKVSCPSCDAARHYYPSDAEKQGIYENRYSLNLPLIKALLPQLAKLWNWRGGTNHEH